MDADQNDCAAEEILIATPQHLYVSKEA